MITMDAVDLTQDEINFIKTRKPTKQLALALLFKCYQESHKFLDDLTKIPGHITNKLAQQIIEEHGLKDILTKEDKRALTPLIYEHVNLYGLFPLDLSTHLPHLHYKAAA